MFEIVERDGFGISKIERDYPVLLHGRAGAVLSREELGIEDEEILDAVRWHTTGKRGMNGITSILYIADYIEPVITSYSIHYTKLYDSRLYADFSS